VRVLYILTDHSNPNRFFKPFTRSANFEDINVADDPSRPQVHEHISKQRSPPRKDRREVRQ
jgi:hypothetical protein